LKNSLIKLDHLASFSNFAAFSIVEVALFLRFRQMSAGGRPRPTVVERHDGTEWVCFCDFQGGRF